MTTKVKENTRRSRRTLTILTRRNQRKETMNHINGQKPHLIKDGIRIPCNSENFVPVVVPGLSSSSFGSSSTLKTPFETGELFLIIFFTYSK